ncbi:MAG: PorT family protein, partial [Bacteroidales bacterium]|nr:PorT family protein [Bacteroidales bacterium]
NELDADNYMQSTLNYLEIPILAKVKLGPVYALGGVYGAYALNGKNEISVLGITDSQDINFDDSEISKLDYGMTFGLGVQVGLGPVHVFAQADYSFGLKNINTSDGDAAKNNVIGVSVGILLGM